MELMELIEQFPAHRETLLRVQRTTEISSVVRVLEGLTNKYSLEPDQPTPAVKDATLTIEDMKEKFETLEKLQSTYLPSIKHHLASLLTSLDLIERKPILEVEPDIDSTLKVLSNLDKALETTVSSTVFLTLQSPLPDEKHDFGLGNLKVFRTSRIKKEIKRLVGFTIYTQLFEDLTSFIQWCALVTVINEPSSIAKEGSDRRETIHLGVNMAQDIINWTIGWCQKSDWAMVQVAWLDSYESFNESLERLTGLTARKIQSIPEADRNDNPTRNERDTRLITEVAKTTIPLVKLGRILVMKISKTISTKRRSAGLSTTELNSETMNKLYQTPELILGTVEHLSNLLYIHNFTSRAIRLEDQDDIRTAVEELPDNMESTLTALDSSLIPFLPEFLHDSPEGHLKSFYPTFKQSWDTASNRLRDVILSFEIGQMAI